MEDSLQRFVHEAVAKGIPRREIESTLETAGWSRDQISNALGLYAEIDFPIPVPRPRPYLSAREAFIYLVTFTVLYLCAWSLGSILFDFINRALPDPTQNWGGNVFRLSRLRWSIATLLIAYPVYLVLTQRTQRAARQDPERRQSKVRKWLTYLTLFLAATVLVADLITLVFNLLEGELTARFLLKVTTVGAIAGTVFAFYLRDLKRDDEQPEVLAVRSRGLRVLGGVVTAVVAVAVVGGIYIAGSPGSARQRGLDQQRRAHLTSIANAIDRFWGIEGRLPEDLDELQQTRGIHVQSTTDPASGNTYEYSVTGVVSYDLCAVFDTASNRAVRALSDRGGTLSESRFWEHPGGRTCFSIEVREANR